MMRKGLGVQEEKRNKSDLFENLKFAQTDSSIVGPSPFNDIFHIIVGFLLSDWKLVLNILQTENNRECLDSVSKGPISLYHITTPFGVPCYQGCG